jgi:hypothetical protein
MWWNFALHLYPSSLGNDLDSCSRHNGYPSSKLSRLDQRLLELDPNMLPLMYRAIHARISHCAWSLSNFYYFFNWWFFNFFGCIIDGFCYCLLYEEVQVANESSVKQQRVVGESSGQISLSDEVGLTELEKMLTHQTFTRYALCMWH